MIGGIGFRMNALVQGRAYGQDAESQHHHSGSGCRGGFRSPAKTRKNADSPHNRIEEKPRWRINASTEFAVLILNYEHAQLFR